MKESNQQYQKPKIVAEIGCNHLGDLKIAKKLVLLAKEAGVKYVKFQKRCNRELLTEEQYNAPHPVPENAYANTYGGHREFLEFDIEQHKDLKAYCEKINIIYSASVWDLTSAKEITSLQPEFIKVPSACNNHFEMLRFLRDNFDGQVQISLGMTKPEEIEQIVNLFEDTDAAKNKLMIYACTSGYPVSPEESCLLEISKLHEKYAHRVSEIGFSGHHLGIALDVAAYTLGAKWIERHFTENRAWKGTDHAASLEPTGLRKLSRDLNSTFKALTLKKNALLDVEVPMRNKLKFRV